MYLALAIIVLALHLAFILSVVLGVFFHPRASRAAPPAYRCAGVGTADRDLPLNLPTDVRRNLARAARRRHALSGRISAALPGRAGLSQRVATAARRGRGGGGGG